MLFEAMLLILAKVMPVAKVAEMTREHDTRIWRVLDTTSGPSATRRTSRR
jgi:hypothetical protein